MTASHVTGEVNLSKVKSIARGETESSPRKQVLLTAMLLWSGRAVRLLFGCQAVLTDKAWPPLGTKRSQLMMQIHPFGQVTPEIIWTSLVLLPFQILAHPT